AGVQRIVVVSIIGSGRFSHGYGAAKVAHERAMLAGGLPAAALAAPRGRARPPPSARRRPPGARAAAHPRGPWRGARRPVGEALADLATAPGPQRSGPPFAEVAGPREESLVEMATLFAERRGHPAKVEAVTDTSDPDHELNENGALLPGPSAKLAGPTFE